MVIPCQASIEEGVTTIPDECKEVEMEISTIFKYEASERMKR